MKIVRRAERRLTVLMAASLASASAWIRASHSGRMSMAARSPTRVRPSSSKPPKSGKPGAPTAAACACSSEASNAMVFSGSAATGATAVGGKAAAPTRSCPHRSWVCPSSIIVPSTSSCSAMR